MVTKKSPQTTSPAPVETPEANRDQVASVSYRTDGEPDQHPGFTRLLDED